MGQVSVYGDIAAQRCVPGTIEDQGQHQVARWGKIGFADVPRGTPLC